MPKNNQKGLIALILPLLLVILAAFAVLIWKGIVVNPFSQFLPASKNASLTIATPEPTSSPQYTNLFEESTSSSQYSNPFEESENPFNNLQ